MKDFDKMTVSELKEVAKGLGLLDFEKLKKAELLKLVMEKFNPKPVITKGKVLTVDKETKKSSKSLDKNKTRKSEKKEQTKKSLAKNSDTKKGSSKGKRSEPEKETPLPLGVRNIAELDSGETANGILEVMNEGFGFIRGKDFMSGDSDVYVSPSLVKLNKLRTGDIIVGPIRKKSDAMKEKFAALLSIDTINGVPPEVFKNRIRFEDRIPIFPDRRINLETTDEKLSMRMVDLVSPIGMGQRGMIVSPPKAGKTTLIKDIAKAITINHPKMKLIILLIDERPEEVTDIRESIQNNDVDVMYSTFDELPDHHKKVAEMVINRAKRIAESGRDVVILLDSITRLARAYNLVISPSGRTLSGGLDPNALFGPKKFFGAARNMREGGSLTILATALVETGSRMDDVIFEEFKGTGNMELVLDRKMAEKRIYPAIDLLKSGTRRDDLLLTEEEHVIMDKLRKLLSNLKPEEQADKMLDIFKSTKTNEDFLNYVKTFMNH